MRVGHVLAEGNELHLVVGRHLAARGRDQVDAVQLLDRARRGLPEGGAAEEQVHPILLRRLEHRIAERAGLLEEEGGGGLGPHHQVRAARGCLRGERAVASQRLVLERGVPLVSLLDVALRERDAERAGRRAPRERRRAPATPRRHADHEQGERDQRGHEPARRRPRGTLGQDPDRSTLGQDPDNHHIEQHEDRRHAVHARHLRDLHQVVVAVLRVAERGPRKADEEPAAQPLERNPEERRQPEGRKPARLEPAHARDERGRVAGEHARHEREDADGDHERHRGEVRDRVRDPVDGGEVEDEAPEPADAEGGARPETARGDQQRDEADPGERLQVGSRERSGEEDAARGREQRAGARPPRPLRDRHHGRAVRADRYSHRARARSRRCIRRASATERSWS